MPFSPYTDNGGTTLAVAGSDFCIVAGDTRQSEGYSINSRYAPKVFKLTGSAVLATGGMYADATRLVSAIQEKLEWFAFQHAHAPHAPGTLLNPAIAQMLSAMLYGKRFFPYYVWNTLGGIDSDGYLVNTGHGCVFSYDPVGNFERSYWNCTGSAGHLLQPFLDSQVGKHHQNIENPPTLSIQEALAIVKDAFTSAAERDIYTGDSAEIFIITKDGVKLDRIMLKRD